MPDQYGDPRPGRDTPPEPETDYAATAKRGLALIRKTMSWNRDETRDETPPPPPTPSPTPKNPPKRNTAPTTGHQTHTHHPKNPPT